MEENPPSSPKRAPARSAVVVGGVGWALALAGVPLESKTLSGVGGLGIAIGAVLTLISLIRLWRMRASESFHGSHRN